jgi:hypothetical protein
MNVNNEIAVDNISWLHGLQEYFDFVNDKESKMLVDFFLSMMYAKDDMINLSLDFNIAEFLHYLRKQTSNEIFDIFDKYYRNNYNPIFLQDAFSRGQVNSKIWAMEELSKVKKDFDTVYALGGWYGQVRLFLEQVVTYKKLRVFDVDPEACFISDKIFNFSRIQDYKVKSVEMKLPMASSSDEEKNMGWVSRTGCTYNVKNYTNEKEIFEKTQPDLVLNTSAEHMPSTWYQKFMHRPMDSDPLFVIQSNNLFDVEEHVNCVHSIDHMCKKFPMERLEYAGEQELYGYKRFMVIGRP